MSEGQKVEQPPVPKEEPQPSERPSSADESPAPAPRQAKKAEPEAKPAEPADNTAPRAAHPAKRRRQHPLAAPLGFLVLVLALVGGISLLISGWGLIQKAADDTPLKQELTAFLKPVMLQNPTAFSGGKQAASSPACIKAAIWQVTEADRIRVRQKKGDSQYESDENDRLLIPEKEVNAAFQKLFGKDLTPDIGVFATEEDAFSLWYDKTAAQYHVPAFTATLYQPVVDSVKKKDGAYQVRVGYVAAADITVDDQGNDIPPTAADASMFQQYTVKQTATGYQLTAIADVS